MWRNWGGNVEELWGNYSGEGNDDFTEVDEMHEGVEQGLAEDDPAHHLVEVDVVIEGQEAGQAEVPQHRDAVAQDEDENEDGVEEEGAAAGPGDHVEGVGGETAEHREVTEVEEALEEEDEVEKEDGDEEDKEGFVVAEVAHVEVLWKLLR